MVLVFFGHPLFVSFVRVLFISDSRVRQFVRCFVLSSSRAFIYALVCAFVVVYSFVRVCVRFFVCLVGVVWWAGSFCLCVSRLQFGCVCLMCAPSAGWCVGLVDVVFVRRVRLCLCLGVRLACSGVFVWCILVVLALFLAPWLCADGFALF